MFDNWITSRSSQSGHVEHVAYFFSASPDAGLACESAGAEVIRSDSDQRGDLLSVEQSQFRKLGQEYRAGLGSYSGCTSEDFIFVGQFLVGGDMLGDQLVNFGDLVVEGFDHLADAFMHSGMTDGLLTIDFFCSQGSQLIASGNQVGQFFGFTVELRPWFWLDDLSEACQHSRIDGVCLGQFSDASCELTDLTWRSDYDFEVGFEQSGNDGTFITAGCFKYDQFNIIWFECLYQLLYSAAGVGQRQIDGGRRRANTECVFGNVDAYEDLFFHGTLPVLQMRARRACGSPTALSAVRAGPTAATRIMLCDDLVGLGTLDLSSPAAFGSSRYARLAQSCFSYGTLIHGRCQHTRLRLVKKIPPP